MHVPAAEGKVRDDGLDRSARNSAAPGVADRVISAAAEQRQPPPLILELGEGAGVPPAARRPPLGEGALLGRDPRRDVDP
jgi:hypothetical protein